MSVPERTAASPTPSVTNADPSARSWLPSSSVSPLHSITVTLVSPAAPPDQFLLFQQSTKPACLLISNRLEISMAHTTAGALSPGLRFGLVGHRGAGERAEITVFKRLHAPTLAAAGPPGSGGPRGAEGRIAPPGSGCGVQTVAPFEPRVAPPADPRAASLPLNRRPAPCAPLLSVHFNSGRGTFTPLQGHCCVCLFGGVWPLSCPKPQGHLLNNKRTRRTRQE